MSSTLASDALPQTHSSSLRTKALLAVLGIVYGDIGTSPLYAFRECFSGPHGLAPSRDNVIGIVSLIVWSLAFVVIAKYLVFIMRANNQGEGGILALLSLARPKSTSRLGGLIILAGLFGAALLYSDGMLTPAISVLSAVEGVAIFAPTLHGLVVPASVVILVTLFFVQRRGTAVVGAIFGPLMLVWFVVLAASGLPHVVAQPSVLVALSPSYAVGFLWEHGPRGLLVLGSVVLCVTGAEALYADMGHFGRRPIQIGWYAVVMPALLINYLGQGALLLDDPQHVHNPFYGLVPRQLLVPMVIIATLATVIASQALISGAFSLTRQAIQLGYLPRLNVVHTSSSAQGQIYIPEVNWVLMVACVGLVVFFGGSSSLAAAYGMAVTGTMTVSTFLFYRVARGWWGRPRAAALCAFFLAIDLPFLGANAVKILHGAWLPLAIAAGILIVMTTWRKGRLRLASYMIKLSRPLDEFVSELKSAPPTRVGGTAVFMTGSPSGTPPVLLFHLRHSQVLHEQVVLLSLVTEPLPHVGHAQRVEVTPLDGGIYRVIAHYGFMESPRVTEVLKACRTGGLKAVPGTTSYYLGRERLVIGERSGMSRWRKSLFAFLSRNSRSPADFFNVPADRVLELGIQVEL